MTFAAGKSSFAYQAGKARQSVDVNPVIVLPEDEDAFAAGAIIGIGDDDGDRL